MKTVADIRDSAKDRVEDLTDTSKKAAYAVVGAPVVAGRRIADYAGKVGKTLQKEFEAWVAEGERLSSEVRDAKLVTEIKERVDFEQLQGRVEKLKDQLEEVLTNWRETFKPGQEKSEVDESKETKKPAAKATAKKPAAKKAAAAKTEADEEQDES
ncbi:MAG: hypothetical protein V3S62_03915 [Acidimicrobiia bacterium]